MLFAAGCGADLGNRSTADPRRPMLDSTVSDEGDQGNELISPAGVEEEPSPLTFTTEPSFCCDPLSIEFAVQQPESAGVGDVTYHWDFGDGRTAAGAFVKHTYPWPTEYTVVLTAKRPDGVVERVQHTLSLTSVTEERGLVAYAGPDQVVVAGDLVVLEGGASFVIAADTLAYEWVQTAGPAVDFATPYEPVATFVAPELAGESNTLIFELIVTADSLQASDKTLVTVFPKTPDADANTPPTVWDQSALAAVGGTILLTLNGGDADRDDLEFSIVGGPEHGTLADIDNSPEDSANVIYTPDAGFEGEDLFTFKADDDLSESGVATMSIAVIDDNPPWARDKYASTIMGVPIQLMLDGDDPDGDHLDFFIVSEPSFGTLGPIGNTPKRSATITYNPNQGFEGTDTFTFVVSDGMMDSPVAVTSIRVRRVVLPWVEMNYLEPWRIDNCVEGLRIWRRVTDTAIVSTLARVDRMPLYTELRQRVPGMRIIPGIKTGSVVGSPQGCEACVSDRFDSVEGWQVIATAVETALELSAGDTVVFENETAIGGYIHGDYELDLNELREGLRLLPKANYIWYPGIFGRESDGTLQRYVAIAEAAVEVLDAQLTGHSIQGTYAAHSDSYQYFREVHLGISPRPPVPLLFFFGPELEYGWLDDEIREALQYVTLHWGTEATATIYPGGERWVETARAITDLMTSTAP